MGGDQETKPSSVDYTFTDMQMKSGNEPERVEQSTLMQKTLTVLGFFILVVIVLSAVTVGLVAKLDSRIDDVESNVAKLSPRTVETMFSKEQGDNIMKLGENVCAGKKPKDPKFDNFPCINATVDDIEQAGANITKGYVGGMIVEEVPITDAYWKKGLCPVNVHWHLGAEHLSVGQFDSKGKGPSSSSSSSRRLLASEDGVRNGLMCHHYDATKEMFTKEYDWKHCKDMKVGATYEVHWPHSAAGACGTPNQYQTPFYDGVFCHIGLLTATHSQIGVQGQVFTIVNDEKYYYPDLMRGMIVDGPMGTDVAMYTGSTTGTSRSNTICSAFTPITWQVDRKCHMISASSFDKMCADMKAQRDDMSDDLHAHGAREVVDHSLAANNMQSGSLAPGSA